jgi:hypothetical protein
MLFSSGFLTPLNCLIGIAKAFGLDGLDSIPGKDNDFSLLDSV